MPIARPRRLRDELEQTFSERPFALRFWDGSELPATAPGGPVFTVRSPAAIAHLLRAPGQLGLGRAYAAGELEADDLDSRDRRCSTASRRRRSIARRACG